MLTDAPWYVNKKIVHSDFKIPYIKNKISKIAANHHQRLDAHSNDSIGPLHVDQPDKD